MNFEVYRLADDYNTDPIRYGQTRDITREDIYAAANRYDDGWSEHTVSKLRAYNPETALPKVFDLKKDLATPTFSFLDKEFIRPILGVPQSWSPIDICEMLREDADIDETVNKVIGDDCRLLPSTINISFLRTFYGYQDMSPLEILAEDGSEEDVSGFLEDLASETRVNRFCFKNPSRSRYMLLLALHAERAVLLPLGIWRDLSSAKKVSSQLHLDVPLSAHLLGPSCARDLRVLSKDAKGIFNERNAPQVERAIQCLLTTTFNRVETFDPDRIMAHSA